jgi:hypothetical protein
MTTLVSLQWDFPSQQNHEWFVSFEDHAKSNQVVGYSGFNRVQLPVICTSCSNANTFVNLHSYQEHFKCLLSCCLPFC